MLKRNQQLIFNSFAPKKLVLALLATGSLVATTSVIAANNLDTALMKGEQRAATAVSSQHKIDSLDEDIRDTERKYRAVNKENDGLSVYIEQLNKQLMNQQLELSNIDSSIRQVTLIERQITPLMLRMIESLELFVAADVPFQKEERTARIANLRDLMGRADVTVAEKYRKVMDAYQKEMDYGRTIKTYRSTLDLAGAAGSSKEATANSREVDFLRVGRLSLMFLSLDGQSLGIWDQQAKKWQPLESEYKAKLTTALRIAREQAAPSLIKIPVAAPMKLNISSSNSNIAHGDVK
jgi:hypothetical protein